MLPARARLGTLKLTLSLSIKTGEDQSVLQGHERAGEVTQWAQQAFALAVDEARGTQQGFEGSSGDSHFPLQAFAKACV